MGILISSKSESYNIKSIDHVVLYILRKCNTPKSTDTLDATKLHKQQPHMINKDFGSNCFCIYNKQHGRKIHR